LSTLATRSWIPHLKEAFWVALGQIAAAAGTLVILKVVTNILQPDEFGRFSAALAIAGLGQVCFFGPVSQAATRFLAMAQEQKLDGAYASSLIKLYLLGALAALACWLALALVGLGDIVPMAAWIIVALTLVTGLQAIVLAVLNAARLRKWYAGLQVADALLRPLFVLAVAFLAARTSSNVAASYVLTSFVIVAAPMLFLLRTRRSLAAAPGQSADREASRTIARGMSSYTLMFVVFGVVGAIGSHGERLLLINYVSWSEVGIYALLMQLAMAPNLMLINLVNQYYLPVVFQSDPQGDTKLGRSYRYYLIVSVVGILAIAVCVGTLGRWIVPLFSSTAFAGHEHLLWYLALSAGLFNLGQQMVLPGMRANRLHVYLPSKLLHSAALFFLAMLWVPEWGIMGMALASLAAAAAYLLSILCANAYLASK
jgi:O-antigen/teichoic acid export membrane protein